MNSFRMMESCAVDTRVAVQEMYDGIVQEDISLVMFFCSNAYDLEVLAAELNRRFAGVPVMGCTSAGGYGPTAYGRQALTGVSFARNVCAASVAWVKDLQTFDALKASQLVSDLSHALACVAGRFDPEACFAFQLIDGISGREEVVTRAMQSALGKIPLVGGSAGDDMRFKKTRVFCDGAFHEAAAVLALVHTTLPFYTFMTEHFQPGEYRMVVTEADSPRRIVTELNGFPAVEEYARCVGVKPEMLNAGIFASCPVVVNIGERYYVRSIQRVVPGGGLAFFCAIEEGVVLRVATGLDLLAGLAEQFRVIQERVGPPGLVLGCECVLRKLEVQQRGIVVPMQQLLADNHAIGFCTYGEQYRGVHINQTLTGIAFGSREERPHV